MCSQTHTPHTLTFRQSFIYVLLLVGGSSVVPWILISFQTLRLYVYWPRPFEDAAEKGQKAFTTIIKKHGKEEMGFKWGERKESENDVNGK